MSLYNIRMRTKALAFTNHVDGHATVIPLIANSRNIRQSTTRMGCAGLCVFVCMKCGFVYFVRPTQTPSPTSIPCSVRPPSNQARPPPHHLMDILFRV